MRALLRPAVALLFGLTLVVVAYTGLVTAFAQAFFHEGANGSLIVQDGQIKGSRLLGQPFDDPRYFQGRPSATAPFAYNAAHAAGSNLGPTNPRLIDAVRARVAAIRADYPNASILLPVDLVTASASGLDPHISPAAAALQVPRVARARGVDEAALRRLVDAHTEGRLLGFLGEPRVNVLTLNLALEQLRDPLRDHARAEGAR